MHCQCRFAVRECGPSLPLGQHSCAAWHCVIVQGIYGNAKPGQLQGLMGPSGAGKSTLMDLLAMRTLHDAEAPSAAELTTDTRLTIATGSGAAINGIESGENNGSWSSQIAQPHPQLLVNGLRMRRRAYMNISAYVPQVGVAWINVSSMASLCTCSMFPWTRSWLTRIGA